MGEQELFAKRQRLTVQLEKLGRRSEEFQHCAELEMIQQVRKNELDLNNKREGGNYK